MKLTFLILISWKHNAPDLEFRYLDAETAEELYKTLCGRMGNVSYFETHVRGVNYMIDLTGISYIALKSDGFTDEED